MATTNTTKAPIWQRPLGLALAFALGAALTAALMAAFPKASGEVSAGAGTLQQETPATTDSAESADPAAAFPSWQASSDSLAELVAFVQDACDPASPNYLEPEDRVATFDMDGTLISEKAPYYLDYMVLLHRVLDDPAYEADAADIESCETIRSFVERGESPDMSSERRRMTASVFAGMTPEDFRAYVDEFLDATEVRGFEGMTYGETFYLPMREMVAYLRANDFDVWVVSGCQREITRAVAARLGIAPDRVIGTDIEYATSGQGDQDPTDFNMGQDEDVVQSVPLLQKCEKAVKPLAIAREIGRRPVLAFGNSSGDYSMLNYAEASGGMGLIVVCDDTEREYGSAEKAAEVIEEAKSQGWTTFSMRDDWATIYGEGVVKTERVNDEVELAEAA